MCVCVCVCKCLNALVHTSEELSLWLLFTVSVQVEELTNQCMGIQLSLAKRFHILFLSSRRLSHLIAAFDRRLLGRVSAVNWPAASSRNRPMLFCCCVICRFTFVQRLHTGAHSFIANCNFWLPFLLECPWLSTGTACFLYFVSLSFSGRQTLLSTWRQSLLTQAICPFYAFLSFFLVEEKEDKLGLPFWFLGCLCLFLLFLITVVFHEVSERESEFMKKERDSSNHTHLQCLCKRKQIWLHKEKDTHCSGLWHFNCKQTEGKCLSGYLVVAGAAAAVTIAALMPTFHFIPPSLYFPHIHISLWGSFTCQLSVQIAH